MNGKTTQHTTVHQPQAPTTPNSPLRGFTLTVVRGPSHDYGSIFSFDPVRTVIGRSHLSDLLLHDQTISKQHCAIENEPTDQEIDFFLVDLQSTNGTRVNGILVKNRQKLFNGDKIDLGDTTLRFNTRDDLDSEYQQHLLRLVTIDPLTALLNKATLTKELDLQVQYASRYQRPLALLMIDIDHFKQINDEHGHLVGDQVLSRLARSLAASLRQQDHAGRFGGEEFTIILPETDRQGALSLAERLRCGIAASEFTLDHLNLRTTVSIGVAVWHPGQDAPDLIISADTALYQAKQNGRNQVAVSTG